MTATRSLSASIHHFGRALLAADAACPDAELVRRFAERHDERAFAALVHRHGGTVFGVCRRVLRHEQDAEDAFQATFVVLARNAGSVRAAGAIGNWLYGVAFNVARKARANRHRREVKEQEAAGLRRPFDSASDPEDWREVLDVELYSLPEKYRAPVVLCDLMGLTAEAAAKEVGCPPKTLGTRLSRGRARLAARLARRGVALPAGALALELSRSVATAAYTRLVGPTMHTAIGLASAASFSPAVAALTEGVTNVMLLKSPKYVALVACVVLAMGGLVRHVATPAQADSAPGISTASNNAPAQHNVVKEASLLDHIHGFLRHLHALVSVAHSNFEASDDKKEDKATEKGKKATAPEGIWLRKEGELKIDFTDKENLKLYPHGDNEVIVIACSYSVGKDSRIKAKITGLEGKEAATEKAKELLPIGTEFSFEWMVKGAAAKVSDVKGDKADHLKAHLEGDYSKKE